MSAARRVEPSRDGVPFGVAWSQEHVTRWLENDLPMAERLRRIMDGSDGFMDGPGVAPIKRLELFVAHVLFMDDGSTYRATYRAHYGHDVGFRSNVPSHVLQPMAWDEFGAIDWLAVWERLKKGR